MFYCNTGCASCPTSVESPCNVFLCFAVRSFGTEDRPTDRPVAPRDEVYEYIIFRGSDIKDIRVCQPPKPQPTLQGGLPNDPAIVQVSKKYTLNRVVDSFMMTGKSIPSSLRDFKSR